jgi:phage/plasmid-like protein (TIGR03299 family)
MTTPTATRSPAWNRLGTAIDANGATVEQALKAAHLDGWNVRKIPAFGLDADGSYLEVPDKWSIVRTNPLTGATEPNGGVVGNDWTPVQNEETAEFLQAVVDQSGAVVEAVGELHGGKDMFVTMRLPEEFLVAGRDAINLYFTAFNNHAGTRAFNAAIGPVRVFCCNQQNAIIRGATSTFKHPHTSGIKEAFKQARADLALTATYMDGFMAEATAMLETPMSDTEYVEFLVADVVGPRPVLGERTETGTKVTPKAIEKYDEEFGSLRHLFTDAETQDNIRGTRWAAYQSMIEWADWGRPVGRKDDDQDAIRAMRTMTDLDTSRVKIAAFDLLKVG